MSSSSNEKVDSNGSIPSKASALSRAKQIWAKAGITPGVAKLMFKGALAPTIVLAAYQSDAWSSHYTTLGYFVGIITQLSVVIQARAKFLQSLIVETLLVCLCAAWTMLACFCAVQVRLNSEESSAAGSGKTSGLAAKNAPTTTYNASASAITSIFLFVGIYGISAFRAHYHQYTIPCIMFAIYINVGMTYGSQFGDLATAEAFVMRFTTAFLTGLGIAAGVSLLVFPITCREILFRDMSAYISGLQGCVGANMTYLNSLEKEDMFAAQRTNTRGEKPVRSAEAQATLDTMKAVSATHAKCTTNLPFAKREIAMGRLGPDDLQQIFRLLRELTIPLVGLSTLSEIFERISDKSGWDRSQSFAAANLADASNDAERSRIETINDWHELIGILREPFDSLAELVNDGLEHVAITLQLGDRPQPKPSNQDQEAVGGVLPMPGDKEFAAYLDRKAEEFNKSKQLMLKEWSRIHGIELPSDFFAVSRKPPIDLPQQMQGLKTPERVRIRRQLMVFLYVEAMLYLLARRTHSLVVGADSLRDSGKLSRSRLIVPGVKRLRKWFLSALHQQDIGKDEQYGESFDVWLGQAYNDRKDPDHLAPVSTWEKGTDAFRQLARFFGSSASGFGLRCAVATMSIAIINDFPSTQVFFTQERLFWAQIMTSFSLTPTAGQSLFAFMLKILGTCFAMILTLIAWYIVDAKTAGVLVFYFIFQLPGMYIMIKHPAILPLGLVSMITLTLIIGYELQVRKIGVVLATSNGQLYHPIYELAPIRLLTVIVGLFVAWVFSVFPYPITEHARLRRHTAKALHLLATYYSIVDETLKARLESGVQADDTAKGSPARVLKKARLDTFSKCNVLLAGLRSEAGFLTYDIPIGGRFPKEKYRDLTERIQSILSFVSLISIASTVFTRLGDEKDAQYEWIQNLRKLMPAASHTTSTVTTLLSLLSASLSNGQPLPPGLVAPSPYGLAESLDQLDSELLSINHVAEPGYAAFAVIQIGLTSLIDDLQDLLDEVRDLVGEMDFSYGVKGSSKTD